jgi:diguanylate cyclase (GGDEF)-like protein
VREAQGGITAIDGQPYQFVAAPLRAPLVVGWVVMGFPVDEQLLADLQAVSGLQARLIVASDRARAPHERLLDGVPHLVKTMPLAEGAQLQVAGSIEAAVAPYRPLQWMLGAITTAGVLLFGLGSWWTARRITEPLQRLVEASDRLGRGDYDVALTHTGRGDEIGDLARAFDRMRVNVDGQRREIRQLAYWDRLTGLPNRLQFREAVQQALTAEHGSVAVLMLDLDRFKHVNDVLGYPAGDALLSRVAERLQQVLREGDVVARLGGDEFAILLPKAGLERGGAVAQRVIQAFEQPLSLDEQTVDLGAGIGLAVWPDHAADADALMNRAEIAMYAAKRRTGTLQVYDPAFDTASTTTLSLLSELRRAVEQGELRLFLQPKIAVADGSLSGAEALVRWEHPQRGLVPPMAFIPFAEQTGFIRRLTLWMFEEVARHHAALAALGVQRVSVNLSTRDLLDPDLPEKLEALLRRHGARPEAFCLEITESAIMDDPARAESTLNRLAERGFKLSIDDFGTGYSSLAYLKRLPVHELKIDKSFVMAMAHDSGDAKIVRSTIDLAHNLGLTVVAEGIENADILAQLNALHCDEGQGFHMSRPLPVAAFEAWAQRWQGGAAPANVIAATPAVLLH